MAHDILKYCIFPELKIIVDVWVGEVTMEHVIECKLKQTNDENWDFSFSSLSDMRNASFPTDEDEVQKLIDYAKKDTRWVTKRKTAHLTNSPNHVVFQTLLNMNKPTEFGNKFGLFSTLESALKWLQVDLKDQYRINKVLDEYCKIVTSTRKPLF